MGAAASPEELDAIAQVRAPRPRVGDSQDAGCVPGLARSWDIEPWPASPRRPVQCDLAGVSWAARAAPA